MAKKKITNSNIGYKKTDNYNEQTIESIRMAAELEAMITDPVYEGKSIAGLIDLCRKGVIDKKSKVLYVHLGGAPAVNAYYKVFEDIKAIKNLGRAARAAH